MSPQKEIGKYFKIGVVVVMQCVLYSQLRQEIVTFLDEMEGFFLS